MRISINNDQCVTLSPRVAEMVQYLIDHAQEIEQHTSGRVQLSYSTFHVDGLIIGPAERRKLLQKLDKSRNAVIR
jgi:hypothetical protein